MCRRCSVMGLLVLIGLWSQAGLWAQEMSLNPDKALTQYIHEVWQDEQGLPQSTVAAIVQTRDGYLWLGTQEGLVRFNGVRFTIFDKGNTPSFAASHNVRALYEDASGTLWIGTFGGGKGRRGGVGYVQKVQRHGAIGTHRAVEPGRVVGAGDVAQSGQGAHAVYP